MTPSDSARSLASRNLLASHSLMTVLLLFIVVLGVHQTLQATPRVQFSDAAEPVLFGILLGMSLLGLLSNVIFVVGQCRTLRKRGSTVTWKYQGLIFGSLIPWIGWKFFDRLAKVGTLAYAPTR